MNAFLKLTTTIVIVVMPFRALSQDIQTTILVLTDKTSKVLYDGEELGQAEALRPFKIVTSGGEHYVQVQYMENGKLIDKGEALNLEAGKQKLVRLMFEDVADMEAKTEIKEIQLKDLNFSIPGAASGKNYPTHYIAFEEGDEFILNTSMTNKKGTNTIEIATYPDNVVRYSNRSFSELENIRVKVPKRSIYRFTFGTNHFFERNCLLKVHRVPASLATVNFNTDVSYKRTYNAVSVVEPASQFVNGGFNASIQGGRSRVIIPVSLPAGTVEWFYRFSASRNAEEVEGVRKNFRLFGELTKLLFTTTGVGVVASQAVGIGVEQLASPPGSNYCEIFLLSGDHVQNFLAKNDNAWLHYTNGSRLNLMSGNVRVDCCITGQLYLGIKNPSSMDGIHVVVEVTAITASDDYVMVGN